MFNNFIKILSNLITVCLVLLVAAALTILYVVSYYSKDLPDYHQLANYNPPIVTRLYAGDGRLLEEYAIEHRLFIPISAIPKRLINAFIAAEDKNFYEHPGIDLSSITRAAIQNIINYGHNKSLVGGSTITQQVVKNFLLTNEKSASRKIKEAILSFRISKLYSKDRILELYLNQIYLGNGSYGVASAALNYFNKSIDELTVEEEAFLAALPKAPNNYDPKKNYEKARTRRDWVIERMYEEKFITAFEAKEAVEKPIVVKSRDKAEIVRAEFFAESVRKEIAQIYGSKTLYEDGLTVRTTLDPKLQEIADKAFRKGLTSYDMRRGYRGPLKKVSNLEEWERIIPTIEQYKALGDWKIAIVTAVNNEKASIILQGGKKSYIPLKELTWTRANIQAAGEVINVGDIIPVEAITENRKTHYALRQIPQVNGGLIAMDPHTGKVLAMVGGYYYGNSEFNRAIQAKRQPGSAFKPFVYLSALENGFTPASLILDGPIELNQGAGLPTWKPKNYSGDFLGPTTLRRGLEKSRNTMTVRLGQMLGIKNIMEVTKRFGINETPSRNFSLVLGAAETTLANLTNAYSIIVNGGKKVTPNLIERIQDRNGFTIFRRDTRKCEGCTITPSNEIYNSIAPEVPDNRATITDPRTAYQMVSILEGVVKRGTAIRAKALNKTLGGKTGTTNDSNDAWFIGFSPDLVVGTYVGYDTPRTLGAKETGASVALPIFVNFMEEALKEQPDIPFRIPEGIKLVKINEETGQPTSAPLSKNVIYEVFKAGTEPGSSKMEMEVFDVNGQKIDIIDQIEQPESLETIIKDESFEKEQKPKKQKKFKNNIKDDIPTSGTGGIY